MRLLDEIRGADETVQQGQYLVLGVFAHLLTTQLAEDLLGICPPDRGLLCGSFPGGPLKGFFVQDRGEPGFSRVPPVPQNAGHHALAPQPFSVIEDRLGL